MEGDWRSDLDAWLAPFIEALPHKTRGRMCPAYIVGLIGPGDRKSMQPNAARDADVSYDRLHHFIASGVWDAAPLEVALFADAGYGLSTPFWQGLSERGPLLGSRHSIQAEVISSRGGDDLPSAGRERPRQRHILDMKLITAQAMFEMALWRTVSWRRGTKGPVRFAAVRVRVADGPPCGPGTWAPSICPVKRYGSSASTVRPANANTICPTCRLPHRSGSLPAPSRPVGSASRRISSSRKNLA